MLATTVTRLTRHRLCLRSIVRCTPVRFSSTTTDDKPFILYEAPLTRPLRTLKFVSLSTFALGLSVAPAAILFSEHGDIPSKLAVGGTMAFFGALTTGVYHFATRGYVRQMYCTKENAKKLASNDTETIKSAVVTAETLNVFGMTVQTTFKIEDAYRPDSISAFVTFKANDRPFFVHEELFMTNILVKNAFKGLISQEA